MNFSCDLSYFQWKLAYFSNSIWVICIKCSKSSKFQQQHWIQTRVFLVKTLFAKDFSELRSWKILCTQFSSMLLELEKQGFKVRRLWNKRMRTLNNPIFWIVLIFSLDDAQIINCYFQRVIQSSRINLTHRIKFIFASKIKNCSNNQSKYNPS